MELKDVMVKGSAAALLIAYFLSLILRRSRHNRLPYPPSPPGVPILGNIFDLPQSSEWSPYAEWARKLGSSIISMKILNTRLIVVNNRKGAQELFDRRGMKYNARPRMPWITEAGGMEWNWGFTEDLEKWKAGRREFEVHFKQSTIRKYRPNELHMMHQLLKKLLLAPEDFMKHCHYGAGALMLDIVYGMNESKEVEKFIHLADHVSLGLEKSGDRNIINIFPFMKHVPSFLSFLPGMEWKRMVDEFKELGTSMRDVPFAWYKRQSDKGNAKPCITSEVLSKIHNTADSQAKEQFVRNVMGSAYFGGTDTTSAMLRYIVLAMVLYPEVQRRAQQEIATVVGNDRLPDFQYENSLPYITATCKELLRWVSPITPPHCVTEDDTYGGYSFPKGSLIIGNTWAITRDEVAYPDPYTFRPERFLTMDGRLNPAVPDPVVSYGYGRRICPGRFLANDVVWLLAAGMVAAFEFKPAISADGKEIIPDPDVGVGLLNHPAPFVCNIIPRSKKVARLILEAAETTN